MPSPLPPPPPPSPPPFHWDPARHALGRADMDDTHREFIELAAAAAGADDADFAPLFARLIEHTRKHFAAEDAHMLATHFPALIEHVGEHRRVLAELAAFQQRLRMGRPALARAYVRESLPGWFQMHLLTMDSALAAHLATHRAKHERGAVGV